MPVPESKFSALNIEAMRQQQQNRQLGSESLQDMAAQLHAATTSPPEQPSHRQLLLEEATKIVLKDRNKQYGNPENNFSNIADYWNSYLQQSGRLAHGTELCSQDVAHLMILMKMARLATNPGHRDSLVDIAGYAACAADCQ